MKLLVSEPFFNRVLNIGSSNGSITLLSFENISVNVISEILLTADLSDSTNFNRVATSAFS